MTRIENDFPREQILDLLVDHGWYRLGRLTTPSRPSYPDGIKVPLLPNISALFTQVDHRRLLARAMLTMLGSKLLDHYVLGVASGSISLATEISSMSGLPYVTARRRTTEHGVNRGEVIEGFYTHGARGIVIEDIIGVGERTAVLVKEIETANMHVDLVATVFNRPNLPQALEPQKVLALFSVFDLAEHLVKKKRLSIEVYQLIEDWESNWQKWQGNDELWNKLTYEIQSSY